MHKEILINVEQDEKRVALVEDGRLEEFYIERPTAHPIAGNIYKGIVNSVVLGINAAFINIGLSKNGFLYLLEIIEPPKGFEDIEFTFQHATKDRRPKDISKVLKKNDQVLVQVIKEAFGTKGPRLTTHIALPGRYLVFMPVDRHIGISKRIEDTAERIRLREILKKLLTGLEFGIIVRTAASGKSERDFRRELKYLSGLWKRISVEANKKLAPCLLREEYSLTQRSLRDIFTEDVGRVIVDNKDEFRRISHFARSILPGLGSKLSLYKGRIPLFESKGIEKEIGQLFERRLFLKCGGYIVIEQTEGLVAIDVNSGHFRKREPEETAFKVNQEAAEEIVRQVRLRDLGGIIVIDFIDMQDQQHRKEVYNILVDAFRRDKAKLNISRISEFGIVEMTRQRTRQDVVGVTHQSCPYCSGRGFVKSSMTMVILILRSIKSHLETARTKVLRVFAHPEVANYLLNENRKAISFIENRFRTKIVIAQDPSIHIEDFRIEQGSGA